MKRYLLFLAVFCWLGLLWATACTPDMINHGKDSGTTESLAENATPDQHTGSDTQGTDGQHQDTQHSDDPIATSCKHDCDCIGKGVCFEGKCNATLKRASFCVACDAGCTKGEPCLKPDGAVGVCAGTNTCSHDCDCAADGKVCTAGSCEPSKRISGCLACDGGSCTAGEPCINADKSIGKCPAPKACQHDCDCVKEGAVCSQGFCNKDLDRVSFCVACTTGCRTGEPCLNNDQTIGKCDPCQNDCDCLKVGGVCESGVCNKIAARISTCVPCDGACKPGEPCSNADQSVGICPGTKTCKHDCDCYNDSKVCQDATCQALRRLSACVACDGGFCKHGDPCVQKDNSIGVCAGTYTCGPNQCKTGLEYCTSTTGGAPPSCEVLPPQTSCPSYCNDLGLNCADGKKRCYCPSFSCNSMPSGCADCNCLKTAGVIAPGACFCQENNGGIFVSCAAP